MKSHIIRGAIFKVSNFLGPGLLENVYECALAHELTKTGLSVQRQVQLPIIEGSYRTDMVVNKLMMIEIKSIKELDDIHHKQVLTYLKLSGLKLGILVNFNTMKINQSIFRKVNNL